MAPRSTDQPCLVTFYTRCSVHRRRCRCSRRSQTKHHGLRNELRSPEIVRTQLKNLFFEYHWANDRATGPEVRDLYVGSLLCSQGVSMATALDALLTLHHGRISGSAFAKSRGHMMQAHAVTKLRHDLAYLSLSHSVPTDAVLGTIGLLNICWQYRDPTVAPSSSSNPHIRGLLSALDARGPNALESNIGRLLALDSVPKATFQAIHERQPFVYGKPKWRAALRRYLGGHAIAKLQWIMLIVPSLLYETDQLLASSASPCERNVVAHRLLHDLQKVQESMQEWLDTWSKNENVQLIWSSDRDELSPQFRRKGGQTYFSTAIGKTCRTARPNHVASQFFYWLQLLEVYHAVYDINTLLASTDMCPATSVSSMVATCEDITKKCQSAIPAVYDTLNGCNRVLYAMPFLLRWYRKIGDCANEKWCLRLQAHLQDEKETSPLWAGGPCAEFAFSGRAMLIGSCG